MYCGKNYQRGGRDKGGFPGGRGNSRSRSGSSGSSSGHNSQSRPTLRLSPVPNGRVTTSGSLIRGSGRVKSPITHNREQTSFTMNGHSIKETYAPSGTTMTPTKPQNPLNTSTQRNHTANTPGCQRAMQRPTTGTGKNYWAYCQEYKIKILGIPKTCWTQQVDQAMSRYGNVVRIEILQGDSRDNDAWVVFQWVLLKLRYPRTDSSS
jgi:RNA-dependent RNA polymerase